MQTKAHKSVDQLEFKLGFHKGEAWKDIEGFPRYQASTLGRVRNKITFRVLKQRKVYVYFEREKRNKSKKRGYFYVDLRFPSSGKKTWSAHRLIAITFIPNPKDKPEVDHINGDTFDNRVTNLRWATRQENAHNSPKKSLGVKGRRGLRFTSMYKGVSKTKDMKWAAKITVGGEDKYLGRFDTEKKAARAYNKEAKKCLGKFAYLNKIK